MKASAWTRGIARAAGPQWVKTMEKCVARAENGKMGVVSATFLVVGNMMGSGVFILPANLAAFGSISTVGWFISTLGAIALALTFSRLASINPAAGGPYAYARSAFGDYIGYQTNLIYWVANVVGNVSICVAAIGYLAHFFPNLKNPHTGAIAEILIIWLLTYVNILGPRLIGIVQSVATCVKLVPIVGVGALGWFWFSPELFMESWNVSGQGDVSAVSGTITLTFWAFLGVESASVSAGVLKNPRRNVPITTIAGVLVAGICYIVSSSVIMGMIPNKELVATSAPFADAVALAIGPVAGYIVAACAALGCLGSLGGWLLLASQSAKAAAADGLFGEIFCTCNQRGVPMAGLVIVAVIMSLMIFMTISPVANQQFAKLSSTAVILTLLPYLYSCIAIEVLGFKILTQRRYITYVLIGFCGAIFCVLALITSEPSQTRWSLIFVTSTIVMYSLAINRRHEMEEGRAHPGAVAPAWMRRMLLALTFIVLVLTFWYTVDKI